MTTEVEPSHSQKRPLCDPVDNTSKKPKQIVDNIPLHEFSFLKHTKILAPQGDFVPCQSIHSGPVFVEACPDGIIPFKFGLSEDAKTHYTRLQVNVPSEDTKDEFKRLENELEQIGNAHTLGWMKSTNKKPDWVATFQKFLYQGKNPNYPPLFQSGFDKSDFACGKLKVRRISDNSLVTNINEIPGSICKKIVFEITGFMLSATYPISISRKAKILYIDKNNNQFGNTEYVYPEDQSSHDPNCTMKHILPIDMLSLDMDRDVDFQPLRTKDPNEKDPTKHIVPTSRITLKDASDLSLYVRFIGGGFLPDFAIGYGALHKNFALKFQLSDENEKKSLGGLTDYLKNKCVINRGIWLEEKIDESDTEIMGLISGILGKQKRKKNKETGKPTDEFWSQTAKLSIPSENFIEEESEEKTFQLKPDSKFRVVDYDGTRIYDLRLLKRRQWAEIVAHVKNVYFQAKSIQYGTAGVYLKLARRHDDYEPRQD